MSTAIPSSLLATLALMGAVIALSFELAVRSIFRKRDKTTSVRIGKIILGLAMAIKTCFFVSLNASLGNVCYVTGRFADLFFHTAMTAGTHVLLSRVQSVTNAHRKRKTMIAHTCVTVLRMAIGIVDTVLIQLHASPDGTCDYTDRDFWGPVYTLFDTAIDLYVTIMISYILVTHIRRLEAVHMPVNTNTYFSVVYHNIIRTVLLTIVNLTSAIFIIADDETTESIMLLWPIINLIFVVLVGYDTDTTRTIRRLRRREWNMMVVANSQKPIFDPQHTQPNGNNTDNTITSFMSCTALSNPTFDLQHILGDTSLLDTVSQPKGHPPKDEEEAQASAQSTAVPGKQLNSEDSSSSSDTAQW